MNEIDEIKKYLTVETEETGKISGVLWTGL